MTLAALLAEYVESRADKLKPASRKQLENEPPRYVQDWLREPLAALSPDRVLRRHRELKPTPAATAEAIDVRISAKTCVSAPELALVLGLTRRRIDQLVDEGLLRRSEEARFPLAESVQAYFEARLRLDRLPDAASEAERLRILTARRQLLEHEVAELENLAADPQRLLLAVFETVGRNMAKLWHDARNVWPVFLAQTTPARHDVQEWLERRLWPLWDDFAAEIGEACPEPHRTAFREARELAKAEADAAKRRRSPLQEEELRRAAARGWEGPANENPYLRPGESLADVRKPVPGLLEEAQARRRQAKANGEDRGG